MEELEKKAQAEKEERINPYKGMPNKMVCNYFNNEMIQKCGFNIEELNFGEIDKPRNKSFILYNYSNKNSFNFDFVIFSLYIIILLSFTNFFNSK